MSVRPDPAQVGVAAMMASFAVFLTVLRDGAGRPLDLPAHLLVWADLLQLERRLVLRAPRGHGKSTLVLAFLLWCAWRHGRSMAGWQTDATSGTFDAVLVSATREQALELMARLRDLLLANADLFSELLPTGPSPRARTRWSATEVRLRNGAKLRIRAFRSSIRGLHPDLLVLDDVLNNANSLGREQRDRTYLYFMDTLLPMHAARIVVVGTAFHQQDLLARLGNGTHASRDGRTTLGFRPMTFRALDEVTGESLWPERFPPAELHAIRDHDPLIFGREYQNDPRDDAASLFPYEHTQRAIDAGASLVLGSAHPADIDELVVLGMDLARSALARADYTVVMVVAWNLLTGTRRVLDIRRLKGLEFDAQIALVRDLVVTHRVALAVIEDNGFQQWLLDALAKLPAMRCRVIGHRTGPIKADWREGIPRLALSFQMGQWIIPGGDAPSLRLARVFQAELGAFGYDDGRLRSTREHDDMVIAAWLAERAIAQIEELREPEPEYDIYFGEDFGIARVKIGPEY